MKEEASDLAAIVQRVVPRELYQLLQRSYLEIQRAVATDTLIVYSPVSIHAKVVDYAESLRDLSHELKMNGVIIVRADMAINSYKGIEVYKHFSAKQWGEWRRWLEFCYLSELPLIGEDR